MIDSNQNIVGNIRINQRVDLPIYQHKEKLIETIRRNQHCIIISSTGSGKTTQLPQFVYEQNMLTVGMMAITQPRRVAAISVALHVAEEMNRGRVGFGPVGYCVRFENVSDAANTRLLYMTDGMLLREAILDPTLSRYTYVVLDEAHERSLNTDVLFGVVLTAAERRARDLATWRAENSESSTLTPKSKPPPLLKIIVMSATIDPTPFLNFLGSEHTQVVYIKGRQHPIKILSLSQPSNDYVSDAASACIQLHTSKTCPLDRGILVFLTGEDEIMQCCSLIRQYARLSPSIHPTPAGDCSANLAVFPLFGSLPKGRQLKALSFNKPGCRKVIVSTNLAETSITIRGIRYVVDCGYAKVKYWDSTTGLETFRVQRISKSQAWQRAGRSGRESAGVCLRLYTDTEYKRMSLHPQPELSRAPLAGVVLNLISMKNETPKQFPWLSRPTDSSLDAGVRLLEQLGAVRSSDTYTPLEYPTPSLVFKPESATAHLARPLHLTVLGSLMTAFPLEPRFSTTLLSAARLGCLVEILTIISMLYVSPVFYVPIDKRKKFEELQEQFRHPDGDLTSLLQVYRSYLKSATIRSPTMSNPAKLQPRRHWCQTNCLNHERLETAIRVRNQLKQIVRGCGLASNLHSCGSDMSQIPSAFLNGGFKDQVVLMADTTMCKTSEYSNQLVSSRQSVYIRSVSNSGNPPSYHTLFLIHPESQLYLMSLTSPPPTLLFIETITQIHNQNIDIPIQSSAHVDIVYMRHVTRLASDVVKKEAVDLVQWCERLNSPFVKHQSKRKIEANQSAEVFCESGCSSLLVNGLASIRQRKRVKK